MGESVVSVREVDFGFLFFDVLLGELEDSESLRQFGEVEARRVLDLVAIRVSLLDVD